MYIIKLRILFYKILIQKSGEVSSKVGKGICNIYATKDMNPRYMKNYKEKRANNPKEKLLK